MDSLIEKVKKSFSNQASLFESNSMSFSKASYLDYCVNAINPKTSDNLLEVASGTCVCGRKLAEYVSKVVCLDATSSMLEIGKSEAEKVQIGNIEFKLGLAENLPFADESFDIVFTRLSFHHFKNAEVCFSEMYRVLKKGGKLVIIDMEATEENLREIEDSIETLRDFSHVKNLSKKEFENMFLQHNCQIEKIDNTIIPVSLNSWLELTKTNDKTKSQIVKMMQSDIANQQKTGFYPYLKDNQIFFNQRWLLTIGIK